MQTASPLLHFARWPAASADSSSRSPLPSPPLAPAQHPAGSPLWGLEHFATFAEKHARRRQGTHSSPIRFRPLELPSIFVFLLLKAKVKPPGCLGRAWLWRPPSWAAAKRRGPEPGQGRSPGGYLGAEGGEAGEPGGAGSHTSHRRSAGEVADLTAAIYARTCPRV